MSNDSNLPRPNIPQPPSGVNANLTQSASTSPSVPSPTPPTLANLASVSAPVANPSLSNTTSSSQASVQPQSVPSGLDAQFPAGPPPALNEEGQVLSTSTISQTIQPPSYDQPQAPVQSVMQKMQTNMGGASVQNQPNPGLASLQTPINPASSTDQAGSSEAEISLKAQQAIAPTHRANEPDAKEEPSDQAAKPEIVNAAAATLSSTGVSKTGSEKKDADSASKEKDNKDKNESVKKGVKMATKGPIMAKPKFRLPKIVPFLLLGLLVVAGVVYGAISILGEKTSKTTESEGPTGYSSSNQGEAPAKSNVVLSYWGLWEPDTVLQEVLQDFEKETGISVDYRQQSHKDYRTRLQAALNSGSGPDVFRFHGTWVSMLKDQLAPIPAKTYSVSDYQKDFYPIFAEQLQLNGQLVGIPLMYDGLALYYNKDILQTANEEPPTTWGEVRTLADKLTVQTNNEIERGGIALGNTTNVEHYADILGLLIYQNGGDPANPISGEVRDAIKFYTSFAKTKPVYSDKLPSSTVAFARGEVAMMLAPSWRVHEVKHLNPELNFGTAPVPKLGDNEYGWASYWAEGVSKKSSHQAEAWQLLKYLSSKEVLRKLYSAQSQLRAFGELYPRPDMASELNQDLVQGFLQDAAKAKSWALSSFTHDNGINDQMIQYYQDAINKSLQAELIDSDLQTLSKGVSQVLINHNSSQGISPQGQ